MEDLFKIDDVTISRIILRISHYLSKIKFNIKDRDNDYYIVDSTVLRIGKGKSKETYSGYKHHHGIKFQIIVNNKSIIEHVSKSYKIMQRVNYYTKDKIDILFNSIANIYNLSLFIKS